MKKRRISLFVLAIALAACMCAGLFTACTADSNRDEGNKWTVTFYVEGVKYGKEVKVSNNRRIPASSIPADPTFEDGKVFTAWYTDETEFTSENRWDFEKGMVKSDLNLYAGYRTIAAYPTDIMMAEEACTSKLVWTQSALGTNYTVKIDGAEVAGNTSFNSADYTVTFTPEVLPAGGLHNVSVTDAAHPENIAVAEDLMFCGAGTQSNPYLIASALDFTAVSRGNVEQGVYYKLFKNITVEPDYEIQAGYVFDGVLDGDGRMVTIVNGNCGLISEVGVHGRVTTLNIAGSVSTLKDSVGACAGLNRGRIEKVNITANVTSTAGTVGANGLDALLNEGKGIAGGVVGTNEETGVVYNCKIITSSSSDGVVKASIGGGCIVGYNKGTVESCTSEGAFGAWNSTETGGKTLSAYSYSGGVVGINAGTVKECSLTGSGKLLAQRYGDSSAVVAGTNHIALGGIAGYNTADGKIEKCTYSAIRVHGDEAIGGIAGINAGLIKNCLAEGIFKGASGVSYVGGRIDVGGIAGRLEGTGSVTNCVSTVNVFAYTDGTAYSVAPKAENCVYLGVNSNSNSLETNPAAVALTSPAGNGNTLITETFDGTIDVTIGETYLSAVNGDNAFVFVNNTLKLVLTEIPELSLTVVLNNGAAHESQTVYETPSSLTAPKKTGYKFTGWSLTEGGEILFAKGVQVSYYDLKDFRGENGEVNLYANFEVRELDHNTLNVSIWNNSKGAWITDAQIEKIKTDFTALLESEGIDVSAKTLNWIVEKDVSSVANLGASVNEADNIDIIIACGTNVTSTGKVEVLTRAAIALQNNEPVYAADGRLAALITENELALKLYSMLTGLENGTAEVTVVGDTQIKTVVSGLLGDKAEIPEVTPEDGCKFIGWATTENAAVAQVTGNITYTAVKDLLTEGKVTLYPVFEAVPATDTNDLTVVFYDKFFDAEKVEPLKAAFEAYCTSNGIEFGTLDFKCAVTGNNAKFSEYLTALEGGFDVAVGGKATSSAPIAAFDNKEGEDLSLSYSYDGKTAEARPAVFMNTRTIAEAFRAFLQTDEAAAILTEAGAA